MATTQRRPSRSSGPAKRPARRKPAAKRAPAPSAFTRVRAAVANRLGRQADDVWGLALVVGGVLCGLGIYADATGPLGRAIRVLAGFAFGWGRLAFPVVLLTIGAVLLRGRAREEPARIAIAAGIAIVAGTGLLHLGNGAPAWGAPAEDIRAAGGYVGAAVAEPLEAVVAEWGAGIVLGTMLLIAALIATRTSVRALVDLTASGGRTAGRGVVRAGRWLTSVGHGDPDDGKGRHPAGDPRVTVFDGSAVLEEVDDAPHEPAPKPRPAPDVRMPDAPSKVEQIPMDLGPAAQPGTWRLPPTQLLKRTGAQEVDRRQIETAGQVLEDALGALGVETRLVGVTVGPTVARYELELGAGVKVAKVTSLHKDIAYAMAADDVRILAPIPGRSAIGVEVPNRQRQLVALGDLLVSEDARKATHPLEVAIGRDIAGRAVMANMAEMPHILIAGATGAGKSSCINSIISSVLMRATPEQVRLILIDPKRVELGQYEGVPHLLTQVVVNPKKAANALSWAVAEMERRYDLLYEVGARDITSYNASFDRGDLKPDPTMGEDAKEYTRLPFILLVVDELNDLMMVAARDVEESICRIAQMARAVGIHLVIATQRPSVDVITGVIKANIPSRLAFKVSSLADSRVILDQPGAERLVGKGDMLLLTASSSVARRIQGPWVGEEEVRKVVAHWRRQSRPQYIEGIEGTDDGPGNSSGALDDDDDDMLESAMDLVVRSQLGSTSMLQRKLKVGFARAGRIMDMLERRGVVGPSEGSKARAVLMTVEELEALRAAE